MLISTHQKAGILMLAGWSGKMDVHQGTGKSQARLQSIEVCLQSYLGRKS